MIADDRTRREAEQTAGGRHRRATAAGIGEATLRRWLRLPAFRTAYRQARRELVEAAVGRVQAATGKAVSALTRNLHCGKPNVEVRAAEIILQTSLHGIELADLAEQLAQLRAAVEAHHPA